MARWLDRVEELLYEGETVRETVPTGEGAGVVVTTHRVLVFTPEGDGANYRAVDRPNVDGVERTARGQPLLLAQGVKALTGGVVLLLAGWLVDLDGLVGDVNIPSGATELGMGGLLGLLQTLLTLLALIDDAMLAIGAVVTLAGAALVGAYLYTRSDVIVLRVAGDDDDVDLPAPDDPSVVDRIGAAVAPEPTEDGTRTAGPARADDPLA